MSETDRQTSRRKNVLGPCALVFSSTRTGTWRVVRPVVDQAQCIKCGICEIHCPTDVITTGAMEDGSEMAIDYRYCKGCGICAEVCTKNAIAMVDERQV